MQYLLRRLALSVLVLFGVSILIFTIVRLLPGDVIDMMIGTEGSMTANQQRLVRDKYGLNDAWPGQEILPLLAARLPTTLELAILSVLLSSAIAIPLGVISALARNGWTDFC